MNRNDDILEKEKAKEDQRSLLLLPQQSHAQIVEHQRYHTKCASAVDFTRVEKL